MPLYEYQCGDCNRRHEELQPSDASTTMPCECGGLAKRVLSVFSIGGSGNSNGHRYCHYMSPESDESHSRTMRVYQSFSPAQKEELKKISIMSGNKHVVMGTIPLPDGGGAFFAAPISDDAAKKIIERSKRIAATPNN